MIYCLFHSALHCTLCLCACERHDAFWMKCTYGEHPWHTRIGNLNIFDARDFGCTAALDAEHYLQEIGALEGFYFPRIMEVNPSPVTPPAETLPSVQISVEHPNLATSIQYGVSSLPVSSHFCIINVAPGCVHWS
ncbi:uncharacterized protein LOC114077882 [Solanum pennellii]|uniref:Uncharacterized protein LOC114077882 n=1 Tax=Solanum pennellii TaxID=28526 RepID=A0ABM1VE81_SOLPN|nr:uncharacterized protein LOC114077882 [Solanum pennellii]XP_027774049.1 uncharacterized protein LOC114077882 [Solanum pennellii]